MTSEVRPRPAPVRNRRGWPCGICPAIIYGNAGQVAHGRAHVRRGDAVELASQHAGGRVFLPAGDARIASFLARGFVEVQS